MSEEIESESVSESVLDHSGYVHSVTGSRVNHPQPHLNGASLPSESPTSLPDGFPDGIHDTRINSFALVSYLPDPLAAFLNHLRHHFAADCMARAHITVLPPRPLAADPRAVWRVAQTMLQEFESFTIELGDVEVFPATQVMYIALNAGYAELVAMHSRLNTGAIAFDEPFHYHPHITLAQGLDPSAVQSALVYAQRRWTEYNHSRRHVIDRLTFVQNTVANRWTDLDSLDLPTHAVR